MKKLLRNISFIAVLLAGLSACTEADPEYTDFPSKDVDFSYSVAPNPDGEVEYALDYYVVSTIQFTNTSAKEARLAEKPKAKVGKDATEKEEEYLERFLHAPRIPVCSGKTAYIRKSYHERIQRIVQVIGKNGLTLSVYVDRVLEQHFREYEEVIRRLYKKNYEDIY